MTWNEIKQKLIEQEARLALLPKSTCGKTNLTATFSGSNLISAALTLPENRHYLLPHTGSPAYARVADIQTLQNALQAPDLGSGSSRTNGAVLFPDGDVMPVPSNSTSICVLHPSTETGNTLTTLAPGNYAFCGGALWVDGESALFSPHNERYAWIVNKNTGAKTVLNGYDFGGNFATAGVRKVGETGEYLFVPHNHNKFVLLNPDTMQFRTLSFNAPGSEAYFDCQNLSSGEIYVAAHKAACSVVIDVVNDTKVDTLPPSGSGYVAPASNYANFRGCKRIPDGRVVLAPYKHSKAWVYDRDTNKHTQIPGTYSEGAVASSSLAAMGDLMLWPWNLGVAYKLSTGYGVIIDPEILTSQYFNGF